MFKKVRNYRKTARNTSDKDNDSSSNEGDQSAVNRTDSNEIVYQTTKNINQTINSDTISSSKSNVKKNRSVLSFEDELEPDDGEVFKVKKSSQSRRLARQMREERRRQKDDNEFGEETPVVEAISSYSPPEYSEESLQRLRNELRVLNGDEAENLENLLPEEDTSVTAMLKKGIIPNSTTIDYAKKQRELAKLKLEKEDGPDDDKIVPVKSNSRLVREDDGGSDDESDKRMAMVGHKFNEDKLRQMRQEFLEAEHGSDDNEDQKEGDQVWERQQIHKVMKSRAPLQDSEDVDYSRSGPLAGVHSKSLKINLDPQSITIDQLKRTLQNRIREIKSINSGHRQELLRCKSDLADSKAFTNSSSVDMPELAKKFSFYQEIRGYIRDLIDCFNEKMPKIVYLERKALELAKQRNEKLTSRRSQDIQDESEDIRLSSKNLSVQNTAQNVDAAKKQNRCAEREARRARRRRWRETKMESNHNDGMSTDDEESNSALLKRKADLDHIHVDAKDLFEDVLEEFHDISMIRDQVDRWRRDQSDSYVEAYVGVCIPRLVTPLVRHQMISWNPLSPDSTKLHQFNWFKTFLNYGREELNIEQRNGSSPSTSIGDDLKIIPSIVEKVVIPKIKDYVIEAWDPLSSRQNQRVVQLLSSLCNDYPNLNYDCKALQLLLRAVVERIEKSIQEDLFIPLYTKQQLENTHSTQYIFLHRQFWSAYKLMNNVYVWKELLDPAVVQYLTIDRILNRYLLIALVSCPVTVEILAKLRMIGSGFPSAWFDKQSSANQNATDSESVPPTPFNNYLRLVEQICTQLSYDRDNVRHMVRICENMQAMKIAKRLQKLLVS